MRRPLLVLLALLVVMGLAAGCVPVAPPPPPPPPPPGVVCAGQPAPPPPSAQPAQVTLVQQNTLAGAITMATRAGDATLYVATQSGHIYADTGPAAPTEVLDVSTLVLNSGEQGLLGMTFSPDGSKLYVHYSAAGSGDTTVDEFAAGTAAPAVATFSGPGSRRVVLTAPTLETNHNGGSLLFGPDSKLYLALGDGGGGNDGYPNYSSHPAGGNGQSTTTLLGKVLRIDPTDPGPPGGGPGPNLSYVIPTDNPFFTTPTTTGGEIWSFGLRNPFRMSFDKTTGDLWIGDVGQAAREEIDFLAFNDATHPYGKTANFGWNRCEGKTAGPDTSAENGAGGAHVDPIFDVGHGNGDCAIIGGYVYRGAAVPALGNDYLYTDNCNGSIRALTRSGMTVTNRSLGVTVSSPSSFGQDNNGELYVLSLANGLWRIDP